MATDLTVKKEFVSMVAGIKETASAMNGGAFDAALYASGLIDLDKSQQRAAMSMLGLNKEQRAQVLAMERGIASVQKYTIEKFAKKAATDDVTASVLAEAMANATGKKTTDQLTAAIMYEILANDKLTPSQRRAIVASLEQTAANEKQAFSWKALGASAKAALVTMATNPMTWVSAGIILISALASAWENAKQKAEETRQELMGVADAARDEAKEIGDLYDTYAQADLAYRNNTGSKDDLTSATDSLLEALGYEKGAISDLIGEYGTLENAIDTVTRKSLEEKASSILEGYDAAKESALAAAADSLSWFSGSDITVRTVGDDRKFAEALQNAGYLSAGELPYNAQMHTGVNNYGDFDDLVEGYERLLEIKKALEAGIGVDYTVDELSAADVYKDVAAKINAVADEIKEVNDFTGVYNEVQAQLAYMDYVEDNGVPETIEQYEVLKQTLLDTAEASGKYLSTEQDQLESTITSYLATVPALQELFDASSDAADGISIYTAQLSDLTEVTSDLQKAYDALETAQEEMSDGGGLSADTIGDLADAEENYLDYLYEENGVVKLNTALWKENANAKMLGEMEEIRKEIASLEEQKNALEKTLRLTSFRRSGDEAAAVREELEAITEAIAEQQKKLAVYSSLYGDITGDLDAYTAALNRWESTAETVDNMKGSFQTLADLQAQVADGFTMSLEKAMEFAAAYPEILRSAQATADGQITLNEGVVKAFIQGKKAELDAQIETEIAKLEVEKAALAVKIQAAQAQISSSKNAVRSVGHQYKNYQPIAYDVDGLTPVKTGNSEDAASLALYQDAADQLAGQIEALRALKNLPLSSFKSASGSASGSNSESDSSVKEVEEYIATIEDYREALERLRKTQQKASEIETKIEQSDHLKEQILLERQLVGAYEREQEALHELNDQRDSTITAGVQSLRELGFAVQYNADTNELWIDNMEHLNELTADSKGEYDTLQEATNALREETEDLIDSLEELNEDNREASESWWELQYSMKDAREEILSLLQTIVDEASEAVDSIQSVYDALHSAADEYSESGYITVDTLQSIIDLGMEYVAYLTDENGQLVINEDRIRKVIAAKTQQLAIEQSLSYIEALKIASLNNDIETLDRLLSATEAATESTWGFVYASLDMAGLSGEQYQAALQNINALRALADSACESIGRTAGSVSEELEKMQSGLNDILDYVMDMLKQRVNDQIDALEDLKDQYQDLIDLKKESLEASKDEADYEKSVAKQLKEIAKLQARIDALSLDDSREAQTEKAELLEELAELQEDLADDQAEHGIEAQEDALDAQYDAYEQEKDAEIAVLEDSISSTEKLYRMAVSYIEENWSTLKDELIQWNYDVGNSLETELLEAWDAAYAAAQRYGDYVSALNSVGGDIETASTSGQSYAVGTTNYDTTTSNEDYIHAIIKQMYANSRLWFTSDEAGRAKLDADNLSLGARLAQYGVKAYRENGAWYADGGQLLFEKYKKYIYHKGGFAGEEGTVKDNEILAKLEKGETVLTTRMWDNLTAMMERIGKMSSAFSELPNYTGGSILTDSLKQAGGIGNVSNITNNSQPVEIRIGDTIIQGNAGAETVAQHIKVTRDMVNQIARIVGLKI